MLCWWLLRSILGGFEQLIQNPASTRWWKGMCMTFAVGRYSFSWFTGEQSISDGFYAHLPLESEPSRCSNWRTLHTKAHTYLGRRNTSIPSTLERFCSAPDSIWWTRQISRESWPHSWLHALDFFQMGSESPHGLHKCKLLYYSSEYIEKGMNAFAYEDYNIASEILAKGNADRLIKWNWESI